MNSRLRLPLFLLHSLFPPASFASLTSLAILLRSLISLVYFACPFSFASPASPAFCRLSSLASLPTLEDQSCLFSMLFPCIALAFLPSLTSLVCIASIAYFTPVASLNSWFLLLSLLLLFTFVLASLSLPPRLVCIYFLFVRFSCLSNSFVCFFGEQSKHLALSGIHELYWVSKVIDVGF